MPVIVIPLWRCGNGGRAVNDLVKFPSVKPNPSALRAIVDLDPGALSQNKLSWRRPDTRAASTQAKTRLKSTDHMHRTFGVAHHLIGGRAKQQILHAGAVACDHDAIGFILFRPIQNCAP